MMTAQQFDAKLTHIEEQFAACRVGAIAYRDQEMARLFDECGWTQEKIVARMGKKQEWVFIRLKFGAFLSFATGGCKSPDWLTGLTKDRFCDYWKRTSGKDRERFEEVARILEHGIPQGMGALNEKPGIREAVLSCLDDGQWYTFRQILATVEETLVGVTTEQISRCLVRFRSDKPRGKRLESKRIGRQSQYRIRSAQTGQKIDPAKVLDLYEQAKPLIDELRHWGTSSRYEQSPASLLNIAIKLERLFDAVLAKEPA